MTSQQFHVKQIELRWRQQRDGMLQAEHGDWLFSIHRVPNYSRSYPAMVYDFEACATRHHIPTDLGTFTDSVSARAKCAEFINQTGEHNT